MYRVSWNNPGPAGVSLSNEFDNLPDAYDFFRYLVYEDGQAVGVGLYDAAGATVVNWDARNGEMLSPSHPDARTCRDLAIAERAGR